MNIIFEDCVTEYGKPLGGYDLLMDMGKYEDVVSYAKAVIKYFKRSAYIYNEGPRNNDIPEFIPVDFCIICRDSKLSIIDNGYLFSYAQKDLEDLRLNVDKQMLAFTSSTMQVRYNVLKNSLFIIL